MSDQIGVCLMNDSFPPLIDGVANAVVNYATLLPQHGFRTAVATPYYPDAEDGKYPFPVVRFPSLDTTGLVGYRAGMPFGAETLSSLEELDFSIIHTHCPIASTMLARTLRSARPMPVILTYHTKFDIDIANAVRGKHLRESAIRLLVENISACDEVWGVSRGALENLRSLGYRGDCRVMPNGVDLPRGKADAALIAEVTAPYELPDGIPVFLFVGRMMWYKGLRIILDALRALSGEGRDFRMVFVGGGGDLEDVKRYAAEIGLREKCLFTGPITEREQLRAWYGRADLFLFPSTFDTNGLVVREAAASALPSVLVRGSCAAEDSTDGQNGFLIEENALSLAECLRELLDHPARMREAGQAAQQELYMSWDEAVTNAAQRYEIVAENYARGLYPEKRGLSDELFLGMAEMLDTANAVHERNEEARAERKRDRDVLVQELEDAAREIFSGQEQLARRIGKAVSDTVETITETGENIGESLERSRDRLEDALEKGLDRVEEGMERSKARHERDLGELRRRGEELWEKLDRFL